MNDKMLRLLTACVFLIVIFAIRAEAQPLFQPYNLDFEEGVPGSMPRGWSIPGLVKKKDYSAYQTDTKPAKGRYCLELYKAPIDEDTLSDESREYIYGSAMQSIESARYRGKRIRIRAAIRAELTGMQSSAHLWAHEYNIYNESEWFYTMEDRPIYSGQWDYYEIESDISELSEKLNFGLMLKGTGTAWIDDISIEVVVPEDFAFAPPAPLPAEALENIKAFAKLYGCVRYFYPGDEALGANWNSLAYHGIKAVQNAGNTDDLASELNTIFQKVAPAISIFKKGSKPAKTIYTKPKDAIDRTAFVMVNSGIFTEIGNDYFYSKPKNIYEPQMIRESAVFQAISVSNFRGGNIEFSAKVRTFFPALDGYAQLWMRIDFEKGEDPLNIKLDEEIRSGDWKKYSLKTGVPANATLLRIGLVLIGDGKAWFDGVKLSAKNKKNTAVSVSLKNAGFESDLFDEGQKGWKAPGSVFAAGYDIVADDEVYIEGNKSLLMYSDESSRVKFPAPGEIITADLGQGLELTMPAVLFADHNSTLPKANSAIGFPAVQLTPKDRLSRLAIVIIAWNLINQFNVIDIPETVLDEVLGVSLRKASTDKNQQEFLNTLKILSTVLRDGQARVWYGHDNPQYALPLLWKWIGGHLIVTRTNDSTLAISPGDEILEINGRPVNDYIDDIEMLISSSTPGWKRLRALAELRAGYPGDELEITFASYGKENISIILQKNMPINDLVEARPPALAEISPGIAYIDMTRLRDKEFKEYSDDLRKSKGFIFDTRGISIMSEHFLGFFIDSSLGSIRWDIPIYTKPNRQLVSSNYMYSQAGPLEPKMEIPVVFIADERSIGYSEVILYLAKKYGIGEIVGRPTAGAMGELFPISLPGGYFMTMTIVKGSGIDGENMLGMNIEPTVPVRPDIEQIISGSDPLLEKALQVLQSKIE